MVGVNGVRCINGFCDEGCSLVLATEQVAR